MGFPNVTDDAVLFGDSDVNALRVIVNGVADVIIRRKAYFSKPAAPELIDEMAERVQVAVAALGG